MGIGPTLPAWKAGVLPLNYTRIIPSLCKRNIIIAKVVPVVNNIFYKTTCFTNIFCLSSSTIAKLDFALPLPLTLPGLINRTP